MPEIDWEREVNRSSPTEVLRWFLSFAEHIDDIVVVAYVREGGPDNVADSTVVRSNAPHSYRRVGLLHDALNMQVASAIEDHRPVEDI